MDRTVEITNEDIFSRGENGMTPLQQLVKIGISDYPRVLLETKWLVDHDGDTALNFVCRFNRIQCIGRLLSTKQLRNTWEHAPYYYGRDIVKGIIVSHTLKELSLQDILPLTLIQL